MVNDIFLFVQTFALFFSAYFFSKDNKILSHLVLALFLSVINFLLYQVLGLNASIAMYISLVFICYIRTKDKWIAIISSMMIYTLMIICDHLSQVLLINIGLDDRTPTLYLIVSLMTYIAPLYIILGLYGKKIITIIQKRDSVVFIGLLSLLTTVIFFFNIYIGREADIGLNNSIVKYNFFAFSLYLIIFGIIVIVYSKTTFQKLKMKQEKAEFDNLQLYVDEIERQYTEVRKFRHDYQNIVASLNGFFEDEDYDGLKSYYYNHVMKSFDVVSSNNFRLEKLSKIKSREIKGIFASKLIRAQESGIEASFEANDIVDNIKTNPVYLVRMLGIILDNAIEELIILGSGRLYTGIVVDNNTTTIIIQNTCRESVDKLFQLKKYGYSTKDNHQGLGLSILDEIIKKDSSLLLETSIKDNNFIQKIVILNKGDSSNV